MGQRRSAALPHIGFAYSAKAPSGFFDPFLREISAEGLSIETVRRPTEGPYAGIELYLPTVAILYLTKPYFQAFLSEMGKDHYMLLKRAVKSLYQRLRPVVVTLVGPPAKVSADRKYSMKLSIMVDASEHTHFKLLFEEELDEKNLDETVEALFRFAEEFHAGTLPDDMKSRITQAREVAKIVLIAYDKDAKTVVFVDGVPRSLH